MKVLILEGLKYLTESADIPEVGKRYYLEDATTGTQAQNKTFHALVLEYWKSGKHPKYGGEPYAIFRDQIKRTLGAGFESFVYADLIKNRPKIFKVDSYEDIPLVIRESPDLKEIIQGKLKSWANYTVKQRRETIDNIIDDATAAGVNSAKWLEILEGIKNG